MEVEAVVDGNAGNMENDDGVPLGTCKIALVVVLVVVVLVFGKWQDAVTVVFWVLMLVWEVSEVFWYVSTYVYVSDVCQYLCVLLDRYGNEWMNVFMLVLVCMLDECLNVFILQSTLLIVTLP